MLRNNEEPMYLVGNDKTSDSLDKTNESEAVVLFFCLFVLLCEQQSHSEFWRHFFVGVDDAT